METLDTFVAERRSQKAAGLATHLRLAGVSVDEAAHLSEIEWRQVYTAAGARWGSAATRRLTVGLLADSAHARCPYCQIGDPEGPVGPPKPFGHEGVCVR